METLETGALEGWTAALEAGHERMRRLCAGSSSEQLNFVPAPGRWSVGQCLDHLTVSMRLYLDPMEPVVERARAEGRTGGEPYGRGTLIGRMLLRALRKPGGSYPAPRSFRPSEGELDPDGVREELEAEIRRLQAVAERANGLALGEITMPWPALRWIRITLAQAFELQCLHTHRHLDQAERVTREPEFPGSRSPRQPPMLSV